MYSNLFFLTCRYCLFRFSNIPSLFGFKQDNATTININTNMAMTAFIIVMLFAHLHQHHLVQRRLCERHYQDRILFLQNLTL